MQDVITETNGYVTKQGQTLECQIAIQTILVLLHLAINVSLCTIDMMIEQCNATVLDKHIFEGLLFIWGFTSLLTLYRSYHDG